MVCFWITVDISTVGVMDTSKSSKALKGWRPSVFLMAAFFFFFPFSLFFLWCKAFSCPCVVLACLSLCFSRYGGKCGWMREGDLQPSPWGFSCLGTDRERDTKSMRANHANLFLCRLHCLSLDVCYSYINKGVKNCTLCDRHSTDYYLFCRTCTPAWSSTIFPKHTSMYGPGVPGVRTTNFQ